MTALLPFLLAAASPLAAVEDRYEDLREQPRAEVMVFGTFHFHQNDEMDALTPERQAELEAIVDRLASYSFTHVGLECTAGQEAPLNARYDAWRRGEADLTENEIDQLGMRLAARLDLAQIHCVDADFPPAPNFDATDGDWDAIMTYGAERGEDESYAAVVPLIEAYFAEAQAIESSAPLPVSLDFENTIAADYSEGRMVAVEVGIGIDDQWYGADWLGRFEGRNVRIFAKTRAITEPGSRAFVLVGTAHKRPLERLFRNSFEFDVIDVPTLAGPGASSTAVSGSAS